LIKVKTPDPVYILYSALRDTLKYDVSRGKPD